MNGISIIVPAFNEEESIEDTLRRLCELGQSIEHCQIVVVDDGSTDNTSHVCGSFEKVTHVRHRRNLGYGAALKTGIKSATYDAVGIIDADGTYPIDKIMELWNIFQNDHADMVVGARVGRDAKIPNVRRPAKWVINVLANYLAKEKIPDLNSGLRIMRKRAVEEFLNILPDGFSFTTTITLAFFLNGYCVKYVVIPYNNRSGKSKIRPIRDTINFLQLVIRTTLYFDPLRIYGPLSIILFLIGCAVLIGSYLVTGTPMDITFSIFVMTSVITLAIGMLADLIDKRFK